MHHANSRVGPAIRASAAALALSFGLTTSAWADRPKNPGLQPIDAGVVLPYEKPPPPDSGVSVGTLCARPEPIGQERSSWIAWLQLLREKALPRSQRATR